MDSRLILVKCITLLYRESLLEQRDSSADLVRTVLEDIKLPEVSLTLNQEREALMGFKDTALYLCSIATQDTPVDKEDLLQRLKINCANDEKTYEAFFQGIDKEMDEGSLKRTVLSMRKFLNDTFREKEITKLINEAYLKLKFEREKIKNVRTFIGDLRGKLEPYELEASRKDPAIVGSVDLGDESSLNDVFEEVKNNNDSTGLIITGWQAVNEMLDGGFRRHEQWVLPALQHKYKTGFTLSLFKQFALYNKPEDISINPNKKPCLVRISFEDDLSTNLQYLYQNLIFNETGNLPNIKDMSPGQMGSYVKERLGINGWHIKMLRVNPSDWNYKDLQNYILELEANGYEVVACMVDYLPMLPTAGCEEGPAGHSLRDLYRRTRNFFSSKKILFITPHQLSTDAKQMVRDGHQDFVKQLSGKGYFAGSKQIDQEVDGCFYMHIEKVNKKSYLTLYKDKHRGAAILSEDKLYVVLPFPDSGPIPDDLGKARIDVTRPGAGPRGSVDEIPFFAFDDK